MPHFRSVSPSSQSQHPRDKLSSEFFKPTVLSASTGLFAKPFLSPKDPTLAFEYHINQVCRPGPDTADPWMGHCCNLRFICVAGVVTRFPSENIAWRITAVNSIAPRAHCSPNNRLGSAKNRIHGGKGDDKQANTRTSTGKTQTSKPQNY